MKKVRVSEAARMIGNPEVSIPEVPDEIVETFEQTYYDDNPKGAARDIAALAIENTTNSEPPHQSSNT